METAEKALKEAEKMQSEIRYLKDEIEKILNDKDTRGKVLISDFSKGADDREDDDFEDFLDNFDKSKENVQMIDSLKVVLLKREEEIEKLWMEKEDLIKKLNLINGSLNGTSEMSIINEDNIVDKMQKLSKLSKEYKLERDSYKMQVDFLKDEVRSLGKEIQELRNKTKF